MKIFYILLYDLEARDQDIISTQFAINGNEDVGEMVVNGQIENNINYEEEEDEEGGRA